MTAGAVAAPMPRTFRTVGAGAPTVWLGLAALAALALALRLPVVTTVLGLVAFGVLHNVLEVRYVMGRFAAVLAGPFLVLLATLITGVLICRLLPVSTGTRVAEIGLAYAVLGAACVRVLSRRPVFLGAAVAVLGAAATTSLAYPAYHFVVLTHLHNVVPLFFLWEWSRGMGGRRWAFRGVNLAWVLVLPGLILAGAFDGLLRAAPAALGGFGGVAVFETNRLVGSYAPPGLTAAPVGLRFLAVFAFMQTMHYVVWVAVLPRFAPDAAARFDARVPALRGRRAWLLGAGLAIVLGALFALDYASGRTLYAAAASYHAYLEFPVLLALLFANHRPPGERP